MDLGEAVTETSPHPSSLRADTFSREREKDRRSLAIGVGFRKRCTAEALQALVGETLARLAADHPGLAGASAVLATIAEKDRPALHAAADALGFSVVILPKAALRGTDDRITVTSQAARACLGIPSVAEAAALAAAGAGSRLLVTRIASQDATCAIACGAEPEAA